MKPLRHRLRYLALSLALLLLGLWLAGNALWQLGRTAMYVHESVVVTGTVVDVRQKPFETWAETLGKGNWCSPGDVSYQPIVHFSLPGGINTSHSNLEADNVDYRIGQEVSIICPPTQPGKARLNRWKFLWGADCMYLGVGAVLSLSGYGLLRRLRGKRSHPSSSPATNTRQRKEAPRQEAAAKQPRRKTTGNTSTSKPRRRRKTQDAAPTDAPPAQKKPRRSRKKQAQEQTPELPF